VPVCRQLFDIDRYRQSNNSNYYYKHMVYIVHEAICVLLFSVCEVMLLCACVCVYVSDAVWCNLVDWMLYLQASPIGSINVRQQDNKKKVVIRRWREKELKPRWTCGSNYFRFVSIWYLYRTGACFLYYYRYVCLDTVWCPAFCRSCVLKVLPYLLLLMFSLFYSW